MAIGVQHDEQTCTRCGLTYAATLCKHLKCSRQSKTLLPRENSTAVAVLRPASVRFKLSKDGGPEHT